MNLLALETSATTCSIGLLAGAKQSIKQDNLPLQHGNVALEWCNQLLEEASIVVADLSAIAYSCGPGSFTGIRIGAAIAQGIAIAYHLRLIAIPSLQVLAQGIYRRYRYERVTVLIDARMGQVYCGDYILGEDSLMQPEKPDILIERDQLSLAGGDRCLVTDLVDIEKIDASASFTEVITHFHPSAEDVISLAIYKIKNTSEEEGGEALPIYLRGEEAWKKL